jgi:two-component system response regulator
MIENDVEILLVEDNANDEMLALYALQGLLARDKIHVVRDGAEALDYAFGTGAHAGRIAGNPQMILLDKNLPLVDGLEVLRQLRADPRTFMIPIVMLTSSSDERDIRNSYEEGANSYIVKPVEFDKFTEIARRLGCYWLLINQPPPDPSARVMILPMSPSQG